MALETPPSRPHLGGYSQAGMPLVIDILVGGITAGSTFHGITLPEGFVGEIVKVEMVPGGAVAADATNYFRFMVNKGTLAAPIAVAGYENNNSALVAGTAVDLSCRGAHTADGSFNPTTTLDGAVTASATTFAVAANASFPQAGKFYAKVDDEIVYVTAGAASNSWTVTRAQDGTQARAHDNGATIAIYWAPSGRRVVGGDVIHAVATETATATFSTNAKITVTIMPTYALAAASDT